MTKVWILMRGEYVMEARGDAKAMQDECDRLNVEAR